MTTPAIIPVELEDLECVEAVDVADIEVWVPLPLVGIEVGFDGG